MNLTIKVLFSGTVEKRSFVLTQTISIGRLGAHWNLPDPTCSRRHCSIESAQGGRALIVKDLGSSNGTYLNGQRITEATVRPGDEIRIGQTILVFREETTAASPNGVVLHGSDALFECMPREKQEYYAERGFRPQPL